MRTRRCGSTRWDSWSAGSPRSIPALTPGGAAAGSVRSALGVPLARALSLIPLLLLALLGCRPAPTDAPQLLRARFLDETPDGAPRPGESILLIFDRPLRLAAPVDQGLRLTGDGSAGSYTIQPGPDARSLRVILGVGGISIESRGLHGAVESPEATGVFLIFDEIAGLEDTAGAPLRGRSATVDLEPAPAEPAFLLGARWIDRDESSTVNQDDALVLRWSRPVEPSIQVKSRRSRIPPGFLLLPNEGDRLDDGVVPTRVEAAVAPSLETTLVLGSNPRLTIEGIYDPRGSRFTGSPSGLAVRGTAVRPHLALLDEGRIGVASEEVIDIDGTCSAFRPHLGSFPRAAELSGHTATPLEDGRIVIIGGWRDPASGSANRREMTDEIWVYDPVHEEFDGPWRLKEARAGHTATYLPGPDGMFDSPDDLILVLGGTSGVQARTEAEVILTHRISAEGARPGGLSGYDLEVSILPVDTPLTPRFEHTAHRLPGRSAVVVVGGRATNGTLNSIVEWVELAPGAASLGRVRRVDPPLTAPRIDHQSVLVEIDERWLLVVIGGYGGVRLDGGVVELTEGTCEVLVRPEVFALDPASTEWAHWALPDTQGPVDPRRGWRIIPLQEERFPWLLVGGTNVPPYLADAPSLRCGNAYRFEIDLPEPTQVGRNRGRPVLDFVYAGRLQTPRADLEGARLDDGRVLLIGGTTGRESTASAVIFDPDREGEGAFEPVCEELNSPRGGFSRRTFTVTPTYDAGGVREFLILGGATRGRIGVELFEE